MNTPFLDQVYEQVDFDRELVFKFLPSLVYSSMLLKIRSTNAMSMARLKQIGISLPRISSHIFLQHRAANWKVQQIIYLVALLESKLLMRTIKQSLKKLFNDRIILLI